MARVPIQSLGSDHREPLRRPPFFFFKGGSAVIRFRSISSIWLAVCFGLAAMLGAAGCGGGSETTLAGTVQLDGTPLPGGTIKLLPAGGSDTTVRSALIGNNGHYYMPNVPAGEVKIAIEGPGKSSDPSAPPPSVVVPAKYTKPDQSGLNYTVKEGANNIYDITLTK